MADNIDLIAEATSARLEVLSQKLEDIKKKYQEGKISAEEYAAATKKINDEQTKLTTSVEDANAALDEQKDKISENTEAVSKQNEKVGEYSASWSSVGASANTALGIMSASLSKTNPMLSASIGAVQKLIPNITQLGDAAVKAGGGFKGLSSAVAGPAGIGLILTVVASAITLIAQFKQQVKDAAEESKKAAKEARDEWQSAIDAADEILNPKEAWERQIEALKDTVTQKKDQKETNQAEINRKQYAIDYGAGSKKLKKKLAEERDELIASNAQLQSEIDKSNQKILELNIKHSNDLLSNALKGSETYSKKQAELQYESTKKILDKALEQGKISQKEYDEAIEYWYKKLISGDEFDKAMERLDEFDKKLIESIESDWEKACDEIISGIDDIKFEFNDYSSTLAEWATRNYNTYEQEILEIEKQAEAYKKAGISKAAVDNWVKEQKIKAKKMEAAAEAQAVAEASESIASAYQAVIDLRLKQGKISQEQYDREFEKVKAFQYAQTVINGLAGGISIMADSVTPLPAKIAAGVALAGQVAASLSQIAATNLDSNGTMTATQKANVTYTQPYQQTYVLNGSSASDIGSAVAGVLNNVQTVLVVDDLNKVQSRQRRVVTNSSF